MAAKKKTRTQQKKKAIGKKKTPMKKTSNKRSVRKSTTSKKKPNTSKKKLTTKKAPQKKAVVKAKPARRKTVRFLEEERTVTAIPSRAWPGARSAGQSGDLQGLSSVEGADSESVDELLEEGNAFEADVVRGVESAADADESEVRTHEVPEDDVPEEYLDKEN
jgi:hypothetical protein